MIGLFTQILSWKAALVAIAVFGFAPGAVLRIIVLAFPRSDPRRRELLADLHAIPRVERPFWVTEQLEVAIAEGLAGRVAQVWTRAAPGRRASEWWQREKNDFLTARFTTGYSLATYSLFLTLVYVVLLVPGIAKTIAFVAWGVLGAVMARLHERDKKRLGPGKPLPATALDRRYFIVAGPVVYATTVYMLAHDVFELSTGHVAAPGYWIGTYMCLLILVYPLEMIRQAARAAIREAGTPSSGRAGESLPGASARSRYRPKSCSR